MSKLVCIFHSNAIFPHSFPAMATIKPETLVPSPHSRPLIRWWSKDTIAVVTGGNKGIGYSIVKRLAEFGVTVILTARDHRRGLEAVGSLLAQGLVHVHFYCLDVSDPASIKAFASWFHNTYGSSSLDILVNNAAVSFNKIHDNSVKDAETVMKTNFYGPKLLIEALLPLFRRSSSIARILNITSRLGSLNKLENPSMKQMLADEETLTEDGIEKMVDMFIEDVKSGRWKSGGWPLVWTDYSVSKLALNAYSRVLAKRHQGQGLSVNCFCPGFTRTSMTHGLGSHSPDHAAHLAVRILLLPPQHLPTGIFYIGSSSSSTSPQGIYSKL